MKWDEVFENIIIKGNGITKSPSKKYMYCARILDNLERKFILEVDWIQN